MAFVVSPLKVIRRADRSTPDSMDSDYDGLSNGTQGCNLSTGESGILALRIKRMDRSVSSCAQIYDLPKAKKDEKKGRKEDTGISVGMNLSKRGVTQNCVHACMHLENYPQTTAMDIITTKYTPPERTTRERERERERQKTKGKSVFHRLHNPALLFRTVQMRHPLQDEHTHIAVSKCRHNQSEQVEKTPCLRAEEERDAVDERRHSCPKRDMPGLGICC